MEPGIRSIKTHLNLNFSRCKTPEMVRKEFWVTMLAYSAIRTTAMGGAFLCDTEPRSVSFVNCCQFVLAAWDVIDTKHGEEHRRYCVRRFKQLGRCKVGHRAGRFEPRVRKQRGSNYNLMMKLRQELRDQLKNGDNSFETK